ncbi:MAG: fatty acid desaturase [Saprospiraceae bacterium]|nr:fatty acid desaturase [Saprospiraceae bacterium]
MNRTKSKSILRYKEDLRTIGFVALYLFLTIIGFVTYSYASWGVVIPLVLVCCFLCFVCSVIVHNTIHAPMFRKKSWNKAFQFILSISYGYSVSAFVPGHNFSHHKETQTNKDSMRTTKARFRWNLLNQALFFFLVTKDVLVQEIRWVKKMYKEKRSWYNQWLAETLLVNGLKFGILLIDWQAALLFVWLPNFYGVWGIVGTNIWQHDGTDQDHPYNHSRTFKSNLLNFFTFNNGYHGAHHEKPGLHWSLLPEYHAKNIEPYLHPNLNRVSLVKYLWEANIYPGKRVDYLGNPIGVPAPSVDEDWIAGVRIGSKKNRKDLGADDVNDNDILNTVEIVENVGETVKA